MQQGSICEEVLLSSTKKKSTSYQLFHFLGQCCFTAIESELQNYHQDVNVQFLSKVTEQLQKITKFQENPWKDQTSTVGLDNWEKSFVKYSNEAPSSTRIQRKIIIPSMKSNGALFIPYNQRKIQEKIALFHNLFL